MGVHIKQLLGVAASALLVLTPALAPTVSAVSPITEYPLPVANASPNSIVTGPDGALWFTEADSGNIGRMTTTGVVTEYPVSGNELGGITVGPDGAIWFANTVANKIGRLTADGVVTQYSVPRSSYWPENITTGPDGALWFTGNRTGFVGRITTSGTFSFYGVTGGYLPWVITTGSDGNLWFGEDGESAQNSVGRMTTTGVVTEYPLSDSSGNYNRTYGIASGSDGALWLTELDNNKIGRITTAGVVTEYVLPTANAQPYGITTGPDGALWFTESGNAGNKIGRITTSGTITEYDIPTANAGPRGITNGPDGNIWFTELFANKIGRLSSAPAAPTNLTAPTPTNQSPLLNWDPVGGSVSYKVYRDGINIGSTTNVTYTDSTAVQGIHSYYVTAINGSESGPSDTVNVTIDKTRPTVTFVSPTDFSSPFATGPTVTVNAADSGSGLQTLAVHVYTSTNQLLTTCGTATAAQLAAGSMSCNLSSLPNGTYYIKAGAFDNAHNNTTINSGMFVIGS